VIWNRHSRQLPSLGASELDPLRQRCADLETELDVLRDQNDLEAGTNRAMLARLDVHFGTTQQYLPVLKDELTPTERTLTAHNCEHLLVSPCPTEGGSAGLLALVPAGGHRRRESIQCFPLAFGSVVIGRHCNR
jgi:hypothetical protein